MAKATSKYAGVIGTLPKQEIVLDPFQERVQQEKMTLPTDPVALAEEYARVRAAKDDLEAAISPLNLRLEALTQMLVADQEAGANAAWGAYGVGENSLRLASGATIRIQHEPTGKVVDPDAYRQWCVENGYASRMQLWPSVTNAIVKERLLTGEPLPEGTAAFSFSKLIFVTPKA